MSDHSHDGHRQRFKEEMFQSDFPDTTPKHKMIELLLYFGVPRKDTNKMAHELLEKFGSIHGILEAEPHELHKVKGMTQSAVVLIKMLLPLYRRYNMEKYDEVKLRFANLEQIGEYLVNKYSGYTEEVFMVISFEATGQMIACDIVGKGDSAAVTVSTKSIVQNVLKNNAASVVISHNHVNQIALPSRSDIETTRNLAVTLRQLNVRLLDHMIVAGKDYISMAQSKEFKDLFIL